MEYLLIKGVVHDLNITEGYEDLSPFSHIQSDAAVAGIIAAVLESSSSSAILASSRNSAEVRMNFFTCFIDEKPLKGRFYKVGFKNGDEMEFVVTEDGNVFDVCAACRIIDHLIWTLPYRTRGHQAQKRSDLVASLICATLFGLFFSLICYWKSTGAYLSSLQIVRDAFFIGFFMVFALNILVRRRFYEFSFEATKIFEVFGFADPENVNLPRTHRREIRRLGQGASGYPLHCAPWQFRYAAVENSEN